MKFLSLYWPFALMALAGGPAALWAGWKVWLAARHSSAKAKAVEVYDGSRWWEPSEVETIEQLNRLAGLLERIVEAADDPMVEIQLGSLRREAEEALEGLAERGVKTAPPTRPRSAPQRNIQRKGTA